MSLTEGSRVLARLFELGEKDYIFLLVIHHIVFDGWSLAIFFRELATLYEAFSAGKSSPLPEPTERVLTT